LAKKWKRKRKKKEGEKKKGGGFGKTEKCFNSKSGKRGEAQAKALTKLLKSNSPLTWGIKK
jgi:hypothetical protein